MKSGGDSGKKKGEGEAMADGLGKLPPEAEVLAPAPAPAPAAGSEHADMHMEADDGAAGEIEDTGKDGLRAEEGESAGAGEQEGEETEGDEGDEGEEGEEVVERPKLEDGFYEIEEIRKRRMRKGQLQYLIKWRGWPETANTWEPYENLQSCADIIEAFEERASRTTRKRKRKSSGSYPITRKKRINSSSRQNEDPDIAPQVKEKLKAAGSIVCYGAGEESGSAEAGSDKYMVAEDEEGCADKKSVVAGNETSGDGGKDEGKVNQSNGEPSEQPSGSSAKEDGAGPISVHLHPLEEDRLSKIESLPPLQSANRFTGAKKRKSGCIRRFKQESPVCGAETQHSVTRSMSSAKSEKIGKDDAHSMGDEAGDIYKVDGSRDPEALVKILKAVSLSASISNDVQDVSVRFVALRSDGQEVHVDNEFLKANHPLMLIDFYEQHLRFGSS